MFQRPNPYNLLRKLPAISLLSNELADGNTLGLDQQTGIFGGPGRDKSPHLVWSGHPAETRSFAITCYDADAPTASGFWHWAVYDIPPERVELAHDAGANGGGSLPDGAKMLNNDAGARQFLGAGPPPGTGPHRYYFAVHALDVAKLDIPDSASPAWLGFQLFVHAIARGLIVGLFEQA
jgi:Raf kinase inhibitor-like YbhB/YbcL family protein